MPKFRPVQRRGIAEPVRVVYGPGDCGDSASGDGDRDERGGCDETRVDYDHSVPARDGDRGSRRGDAV